MVRSSPLHRWPRTRIAGFIFLLCAPSLSALLLSHLRPRARPLTFRLSGRQTDRADFLLHDPCGPAEKGHDHRQISPRPCPLRPGGAVRPPYLSCPVRPIISLQTQGRLPPPRSGQSTDESVCESAFPNSALLRVALSTREKGTGHCPCTCKLDFFFCARSTARFDR